MVEVLPDFRFVRNLACKITPELDLYINIKTLGDNGNYIVDISDTDYTFTNNNINNKCIFSDFDRVLTISIIDLQTRLLDILQDSKSNMVDSNVKIKVDNELDNEIKHIDSEEVKNKVNDVIDSSELMVLQDLYNRYIVSIDDLIPNYVDILSKQYTYMFNHHIEIGVLYPKLKFNYDYGYYLNSKCAVEYGIVKATVVPFDLMISTDPIDVKKDIEYKYDIFVKTQYSQGVYINGLYVLDKLMMDKCKKLYKTIFSKYIELGVLKDELELVKARVGTDYYEFSTVDGLYN